MNGGRQVHYFFFFWYHSVHFPLQQRTTGADARAHSKISLLVFFFQCFFYHNFVYIFFFLSNFRSFCTEWSKGEQQGKYAKEKSHFLAIIFCCSRSILECSM